MLMVLLVLAELCDVDAVCIECVVVSGDDVFDGGVGVGVVVVTDSVTYNDGSAGGVYVRCDVAVIVLGFAFGGVGVGCVVVVVVVCVVCVVGVSCGVGADRVVIIVGVVCMYSVGVRVGDCVGGVDVGVGRC